MVNPLPAHASGHHPEGRAYVDPGDYATFRTGPVDPAEVAARRAQAQAALAEYEQQQQIRAAHDVRRNLAAQRLTMVNVRHLAHAWEKRFSDPMAPWALVIFYAEPDNRVAACVRWLLDGDAESLPDLLYTWLQLLGRYAQTGPLDPLRHLDPHHRDPMRESAVFWGLGVSSLDTLVRTTPVTRGGLWRDVWPKTAQANIGGLGFLQLVDGSQTVIDRRGVDEYGHTVAYSTHPPGRVLWGEWARVSPPDLTKPHAQMWSFLHQLTALIHNSGRTPTVPTPREGDPPDGQTRPRHR